MSETLLREIVLEDCIRKKQRNRQKVNLRYPIVGVPVKRHIDKRDEHQRNNRNNYHLYLIGKGFYAELSLSQIRNKADKNGEHHKDMLQTQRVKELAESNEVTQRKELHTQKGEGNIY